MGKVQEEMVMGDPEINPECIPKGSFKGMMVKIYSVLGKRLETSIKDVVRVVEPMLLILLMLLLLVK
jgi:hypothetical protein